MKIEAFAQLNLDNADSTRVVIPDVSATPVEMATPSDVYAPPPEPPRYVQESDETGIEEV